MKAGDSGTRANFGFNIKYNRTGKNLQGNINIIIRRTESDGILHVYQIKGNAMTSLSVDPSTGKASIQDITDPLAPVSVDGNATLQIVLTDKGELGTGDIIGITVWNKGGGLWFSSNWSGTKTVGQTLGGGNLVVRGGAVVASTAGLSVDIPYLGYILAGLLGCFVIAMGMVMFFMWGRPLPTRY